MKPIIEFINKDTVKVTGKNLNIVIRRENGLIRFSHNVQLFQLELNDANAFAQALDGLVRSA